MDVASFYAGPLTKLYFSMPNILVMTSELDPDTVPLINFYRGKTLTELNVMAICANKWMIPKQA